MESFFRVTLYFVDRDGDRIEVVAKVGSSLLDVAIDNDVELEGIFITTSDDQMSLSIKCLYKFYYLISLCKGSFNCFYLYTNYLWAS